MSSRGLGPFAPPVHPAATPSSISAPGWGHTEHPGRGAEGSVQAQECYCDAHPRLNMNSQRAPRARRFPIEAGDCPSSAAPPETQEPVGAEQPVGRQLWRCPGSHCLTLPHVPIDVFIAMGGSGRPRTT
ncbi:protein FAM229A [Chlamydotis macqueenii]